MFSAFSSKALTACWSRGINRSGRVGTLPHDKEGRQIVTERNAEHSEANADATTEATAGSTPAQDRPKVTTRERLRGRSAGDIHGAFVREARRALERAGGDALQATNLGLSRLRGDHLITARDADRLSRILEVMFAQAHGEEDRSEDEAFREVRDIYQDMVLEADTTPTALAIGSVAIDAFLTALVEGIRGDGEEGEAAAAGLRKRLFTMVADGAGAVVGGIVGGALGGSEGAQAGAAVGGIGASAGADKIQSK